MADTTTTTTAAAAAPKKQYQAGKKPFHKGGSSGKGGGDNAHKKSGSGSGGGGGGQYHTRGPSSNDGGPANKKRRTKLDRAKAKPAFDLVARAKAIWGIFRSKRLEKEEREKLSEELYSLIKGKLHQIAVKHDAARVVQAALKHGNKAQQEAYITELLEYLLEFSKVQYAHFIVLRLLDVTVALPAERKRVLKVFANKAHTLATHAVGAKVLEGIFSTYPKQETQALRAELYGRETTLLLGDLTGGGAGEAKARDLQAILAELPDRREKVLANVVVMIQKMLVKDLVALPFVQELIWEYVQSAGPVLVRELVPTLMDYLLLLTGTRPGCKVLAECAAYGTPKDRKKMLKALKGYVVPTLLHKDAYLFILRLSDVVDDTVTFSKAVWNELLEKNATEESMLRFATHVKASKILLLLLAPTKRNTFLMKDEADLLKPAFIPASALRADKKEGDGAEENDEKEGKKEAKAAASSSSSTEDDAMVPTSKKDPQVRREELLAPLKDALIQLGKDHAHEMLCSAEGSFILYEVATLWRDPALLEAIAVAAAADEGLGKADDAMEEASEDGSEGGSDDEEEEEDEEAERAKEAKEKDEKKKKAAAAAAAGKAEDEDMSPPREHRIAYKTIKRLILHELGPKPGSNHASKEVPPPLFSQCLYRQASGSWMKWLASIRGGFLVEALVKVPEVGPQVMEELASHKAELAELAKTMKGAAAVREIMGLGNPSAKTPPKKGKGGEGKGSSSSGKKKGSSAPASAGKKAKK